MLAQMRDWAAFDHYPIEDIRFGDITVRFEASNKINISYCYDMLKYNMVWDAVNGINGGYYDSNSGSLLKGFTASNGEIYSNGDPFYLKINLGGGLQPLVYDFKTMS